MLAFSGVFIFSAKSSTHLLSLLFFRSIFPCGEGNDEVHIIGLYRGFMGSLISADTSTFCAAVEENISLFRVWLGTVGKHNASTGVGSISWENIHMERGKAEGTMVARGVTEGFYLLATVGTSEATVIFGESFLFHIHLIFLHRSGRKYC
jgi:hypothetical protein